MFPQYFDRKGQDLGDLCWRQSSLKSPQKVQLLGWVLRLGKNYTCKVKQSHPAQLGMCADGLELIYYTSAIPPHHPSLCLPFHLIIHLSIVREKNMT